MALLGTGESFLPHSACIFCESILAQIDNGENIMLVLFETAASQNHLNFTSIKHCSSLEQFTLNFIFILKGVWFILNSLSFPEILSNRYRNMHIA